MKKTFILKCRRKIAVGLLFIWIINLLLPAAAYALTSGPAQPESASFQPAGVSDMVDIFTGDFKYNIPLLDVDGYPLNLSYQSGTGMDDEASWVGLGWNINAGAINRQLRGIPDDFSGDILETTHYTKPKITVGGKLTAKVEIKGKAIGKIGEGSFTLGVFSDNYTGIGAEIGANAGISFSFANDGIFTAGLGLGVNSNTSSGVDVSSSVSMAIGAKTKQDLTINSGSSASLGYNTRAGMKDFTLLQRFYSYNAFGTAISYNTPPVTPRIQIPYKTKYGSFSIDVGGVAWVVFAGGGGTGYQSVREVQSTRLTNQEYGFLYAERGKSLPSAVMDFIREKENPIIPDIPNLALPVHTPDVFSYTSQAGGGQFRLYRGGTGEYFDNEVSDKSEVSSLGLDAGFGTYAHGGVTLFNQQTKNTTRKWKSNNAYLNNGDFQDISGNNPNKEHVYFRHTGEKSLEDGNMVNQLYGTAALAVNINGISAASSFRNKNASSGALPVAQPILKNERQLKRNVISYLTATEARKASLDTGIATFAFNTPGFSPPVNNIAVPDSIKSRVDAIHKGHHISEITVTDDVGKRMVYAVPVYNIKQEEYTFAVGNKLREYTTLNQNQVQLKLDNTGRVDHKKGIDHYYQKEAQPAYAASYLLSSVLSPDYVDRTGNGISSDDNGTAIKFNYSKLPFYYKWRTPYATKDASGNYIRNATLNKGMLADPDDDKGSIIYGEKEIYYTHSIESKTRIAYFITADRLDGLGVTDWRGDRDTNHKQKLLKEIRLFSKADMTRPIKVVKFEYSYELCPGTPNSMADNNGKLTLKKVWFQYGNTDKGKNHPYEFSYRKTAGGVQATYKPMNTDRWGVYKASSQNPLPVLQNDSLQNDEYPYTSQQDAALVAENASLWHLDSIGLPTGGSIHVTYESDDYAYVQNKNAMVMTRIESFDNPANKNSLAGAKGIRISIDSLPPPEVQTITEKTAWFKKTYLNGSDYIYSKLYVKIATANSPNDGCAYDFVPCYSKIKTVNITAGVAAVIFEDMAVSGITENPVRIAAWQRLKEEYPRYAYPGFMNRVSDNNAGKAIRAAVTAIFNAAANLNELRENFYEKARRKRYAAEVNLDKSFVKIVKTSGHKLGGGVRVKKVQISDNWEDMADNPASAPGVYGQQYDYITTENGKTISSGVASYEPSVGNDENPFKQPVPYVQKIKGGISNFFNLEEPFCESLFPTPVVGYSKVRITDLDKDGNAGERKQTGSIVNEFYTAKEFPVHVNVLGIKKFNPKPRTKYGLIVTNSIDQLCLSQGYSIELNDMHGKAKAITVYNSSGSEISSTVYHYNTEPDNAGEMKLKNVADIIRSDGTLIPGKVIGRDIEFFTDFREQESVNNGNTINIGADLVPLLIVPILLPHFPVNLNNDYKLFRSACAVKVVQYYGIIDKVVKTENGSSITTENIAYDGLTGDALVTRTQNEFNQYIYSVNLPAYWVYPGMGGAYKSLGTVLSQLSTASNGSVNSAFNNYLFPGDEISDVGNGKHYWVIKDGTNRLIDRNGKVQQGITINLAKVIRSGLQNNLQASTSSVVCLKNPIQNNKLMLGSNADLSSDLKVINASVTLFDNEWVVRQGNDQNKAGVENTSTAFDFKRVSHPTYGDSGAIVYVPLSNPQKYQSEFFQEALNSSAVWLNTPIAESVNEPIGFSYEINITQAGTYYIGYAGDNVVKIRVDNGSELPVSPTSFQYWHIYPLTLTAGKHILNAEVINLSSPGQDNEIENPGALGIEIYQNTLNQLLSANAAGAGINKIFSTANIVNRNDIQSYRTVNGNKVYHYSEADYINPYIHGFLGNWRIASTKVYQQKRSYTDVFNPVKKGMDLKNAGSIADYLSYWYYDAPQGRWAVNTAASNWVSANTISLYDKYGQELENKDALNRFSAAKFDFNGEVPAAVASNAMNREIYVNSFEDNRFRNTNSADTVGAREFRNTVNQQQAFADFSGMSVSHTGNYSALLPTSGLSMHTIIHTQQHKTQSYLSFNSVGEYTLRDTEGLYPRGFEPMPNKKYVFNAWIKDAGPADSIALLLRFKTGTSAYSAVTLTTKAIIEGWKLVEGSINLNSAQASKLEVSIMPAAGSTVYIDDVRIHPFDAHMKSYAYDDKTMRLMAELDENGFATFYEYDDEGSLIRVKKETERGIMTLKESRSSYRKRAGL